MRMKFIAICTPTLGTVTIEWASALRALMMPLNTGYSECFGKDDVGGEIAEGRNGCVARAMSYENEERQISHLFWLDDDVIAPRTSILQLIRHNADIASGVYFTKGEMSEPLIFPGRGCGTEPFIPNKAFETWGHGMGLTLVKMDVYRKMQKELKLGNDKYGKPQWYKTPGALDAEIVDEVLFAGGTEDLYFLHKAHSIGIKSIVDTSRFAFGWHYCSKRKTGFPQEQYQQYITGQPITWETKEGKVVWGEAPAAPIAAKKPHRRKRKLQKGK